MDRRRKIINLAVHGATQGERDAAKAALKRMAEVEGSAVSESILPQTKEDMMRALTEPSYMRAKWDEALEKGRMWEYDLLYEAVCKVVMRHLASD